VPSEGRRCEPFQAGSIVAFSAPSEITPIRDQRCAEWSRMLSSAVSSAGSRRGTPSWISTGGGASTGTAARGGGSNGERVPRTGWRFVRHLNRLSALAFLRPVRKVSLGAEFPTPFRESILRPGLPTSLPRAGRAEKYRTGRAALGKSRSWRSERARFSFSGSAPGDGCAPSERVFGTYRSTWAALGAWWCLHELAAWPVATLARRRRHMSAQGTARAANCPGVGTGLPRGWP